uniref:Uncharacterized protein n=1 Tax=Chromera velia CCMP2878 TaxID=1169474 RepID=A0A0G4G9B5_9ALVE|eukprot:Cvel_20817.t1-p1 / transcript=Cvel_20817.t1 / gene=Cvel_20817 / organism=Chromera_velia_CCMP2878 / gene_product=hypothetical protein / transcript_product=hypothetical protein / location=Cvel_scaffold1903:12606-13292(+) / protein_length=229 / sequence_SO=supercontig / SO=protein_coding / is_pseudo=false
MRQRARACLLSVSLSLVLLLSLSHTSSLVEGFSPASSLLFLISFPRPREEGQRLLSALRRGLRRPCGSLRAPRVSLFAVEDSDTASAGGPVLSEGEQRIFNLMESLHESEFDFRVIVVGPQTQAVLETTMKLGPIFRVNKSPRTGKSLLTLASEDQSTELHLQLESVTKVCLVAREIKAPDGQTRYRRLLRLLREDESGVATLILADDSTEAAAFFSQLVEKYGSEFTV